MKTATLATVKKIIRENGMNVEDFDFSPKSCQIEPNWERLAAENECSIIAAVTLGNLMVEILDARLTEMGIPCTWTASGFGGRWLTYNKSRMTASEELAFNNVD